MPVLFIGHGNPMNAIEQNTFHRSWQELGRQLPKPQAVLCISAHWETDGVFVTSAQQPETIHDFGGFPQALFDVQYRAPGSVQLAHRTTELLSEFGARLDPERGLDHGAWSVLAPMYPAADVPVVQLSLATRQTGSFHYTLAGALAPLRDEGVLIAGSGGIVHNLRTFSFHDPRPQAWAVGFDTEVKRLIVAGEHDALAAYERIGPHAKLSVPTPEHYLPLLYPLALRTEAEPLCFFNSELVSSLSMTSFRIGTAP